MPLVIHDLLLVCDIDDKKRVKHANQAHNANCKHCGLCLEDLARGKHKHTDTYKYANAFWENNH